MGLIHVALTLIECVELVRTELAPKWFLAGVGPHVPGDLARVSEALETDRARHLLVAPVAPLSLLRGVDRNREVRRCRPGSILWRGPWLRLGCGLDGRRIGYGFRPF